MSAQWFKKRHKKTKKKGPKRIFLVLTLVLLCFLTGRLILSFQKRIWQGGRFNFVLVGDSFFVFSLCPRDKSFTVVKIPENTYLEVTSGFGLYRVGAVYPLGQLEGRGGPLLIETIQEFLGVPVEGYMNISSKLKERFSNESEKTSDAVASSAKLDKEEVIDLKRKITSWTVFLRPGRLIKFLKKDLETNLTFWDLAKIWWQAKKVNPAKFYFLDLDQGGTLVDYSLADGGIGKTGDPLLLDNLLAQFFFEPEIREEKITIQVLNGTDYPGLGKQATRMIVNLGAKVTEVAKTEEIVKRSQLIGTGSALKSFTFQKIKKIFACQVIHQETEGLKLIIGEDYKKKLFSKEGR